MPDIYKFFGGRKMFVFFFMYFSQYILVLLNRWTDGFGYASIGLYGIIVAGIEYNKRGKNNVEE